MLLNCPIRACQCLAGLYLLTVVTAHCYKETERPQFHSGWNTPLQEEFLAIHSSLLSILPTFGYLYPCGFLNFSFHLQNLSKF